MARSDKLLTPHDSNDNPHDSETVEYDKCNVKYWTRSTQYWEQAAWVNARNGDEDGFNGALSSYEIARAMLKMNQDSLEALLLKVAA